MVLYASLCFTLRNLRLWDCASEREGGRESVCVWVIFIYNIPPPLSPPAPSPRKIVIWLILPVVICLSQRLSHACLSINSIQWNCEWLIKTVIVYLIMHTIWITVVILELIHAINLTLGKVVFIRYESQ